MRFRQAQVNTSADYHIPHTQLERHRFARKGGGVNTACALDNNSVKGHFFARLYKNDVANRHVRGVNGRTLTVLTGKSGAVGSDIHKLGDGPS